ncbi:hypothetical protein LTS10_012915 [Elasticomyces elasticus]|nr:hypothetical protein LTS10_012915 [Elasticomyces elasticus]
MLSPSTLPATRTDSLPSPTSTRSRRVSVQKKPTGAVSDVSETITGPHKRKCRFCTRTFTKTEHLKRHQRSHTGERPYICSLCGKEFARSDVLARHFRVHTPPPEDCSGVDGPESCVELGEPTTPPMISIEQYSSSQAGVNPAGVPSEPRSPPDYYPHGFRELPWPPMEDAVLSDGPHDFSLQHETQYPAADLSSFVPQSSATATALAQDTASLAGNAASLMDFSTVNGGPRLQERHDGQASNVRNFGNWLEDLADGDAVRLHTLMNGRAALSSANEDFDFSFFESPPVWGTEPVLAQRGISNESFEKVQQQWPIRFDNANGPKPSLWHSLWTTHARNLIADLTLVPPASADPGPRWCLTDETRRRIHSYIVSPLKVVSEAHTAATHIELPPNGIWNIGLELFFRHFHPLLPFVHVPTFHPNAAPIPTLVSMCLIGFHILNTKGTNSLLSKIMRVTLSKARKSISEISETQPILAINDLANAFLVGSLGAMTGEYTVQEEYRQLYRDTLVAAQKQQFFCSQSAYSRECQNKSSTLHTVQDYEAWARVESAKRLIVCLFMTDSWFAEVFRMTPVVQTNYCQILLPCSNAMFECPSSSRWEQMASERHIESGAIISYPGGFTIQCPQPGLVLDPFATYAILCTIRLRLCASYHNTFNGGDASAGTALPWQRYESDPNTKDVASLLLSLPNLPIMAKLDANGNVVWHHTCISLAADLTIFECAAGQGGPDLARPALVYIEKWAKTTAARRACVHAAQAFRAMNERRVNEGVMFTAVPLLFQCALVLGFSILFRQKHVSACDQDASPEFYDLLRPVDWDMVGSEGLCTLGSGNLPGEERDINPTIRFVRGETEMCFGNSMHAPIQQSAKLVLLEFAGLLDDVATKWKVGDYANVLRVLSETVFED